MGQSWIINQQGTPSNLGVSSTANLGAAIGSLGITGSSTTHHYRTAGTASKLTIGISVNTITASSTYTFTIAAANKNQIVSIPSSTTGQFTDNSDTDAVSIGDQVETKLVSGGTGTNIFYTNSGFLFLPSTGGNTFCKLMGGRSNVAAPNYRAISGIQTSNIGSSTEANFAYTVRTAGTWSDLQCYSSTGNATVTNRINNGAGSQSLSGSALQEDTTHTDSISSGNTLDYNVGSTGVVQLTSSEFTTTNGYWLAVGEGTGTISHNLTDYFAAWGYISATGTESNVAIPMGMATLLDKFAIYLSTNGVTLASTFTVRKNSSNGSGSISVSASTTGYFEDSSDSDSFNSTDTVNIAVTTGATGTSTTVNLVGFRVSQGSVTTTQTQTGTARITATTTKTQTGTARVTATTTNTQTGISRIQDLATKTQTGISRICAISIKTQTGTARVTETTTQTQTGTSRIQELATKTQTGISRIQELATKTQTGTARITATTTQTQTGKARIQEPATKTQTGISRIQEQSTKTQTGTARVTETTTKTQTGIARIQETQNKTQTGVSRIQETQNKTQTGISRITITTTQTQTGTAAINGVVVETQTGIARIQETQNKTQTGVSRISITQTKTQTGVANLANLTTQTQAGTALINIVLDLIVAPRYFVSNGLVDFICVPRYSINQTLDFIVAPRYSNQFIDKIVCPRYGVKNNIDFIVAPRYCVLPAIGSNSGSGWYIEGLTGGLGGTPISPYTLATNTNNGDLTCLFTVYKTDIGSATILQDEGGIPLPFVFIITRAESQPDTWSFNLVDGDGRYNPESTTATGPFNNLLDEQPFTGDGDYEGPNIVTVNNIPQPPPYTLSKTLAVSINWAGFEWDYTGIGISFTYTRDWGEGTHFNFSWKGTDFSILLDHDAQTMATVRSGPGHGVNDNISVMASILEFYHVNYDLGNIISSDIFPVPLMHRQNGNPRDWLTSLLGCLLYEWTMVKGTIFTPYLPSPLQYVSNGEQLQLVNSQNIYGNNTYTYNPATIVPTFIHNFATMSIKTETFDGSLQKIYNRVVAIRAAEGGSNSYEQVVQNYGNQYSVTFSTPLSGVQYNVIYASGGFFSNFLYYSKGTLIAVREVTQGSVNYGITMTNGGTIVDADMVTFTWGILPGGGNATGSPGKIQFTGQPQLPATYWGGAPQFDPMTAQSVGTQGSWDFAYVYNSPSNTNPVPGFKAMSQNISLVQKYGLRQLEIQANPLIPNKLFLQKFADRWLFKASRQCRKATYKIPLNLALNVGYVVRELDYSLGIKSGPFLITVSGVVQINPAWVPVSRDRVVTTLTNQISLNPEDRSTTYSGNTYTQES